MPANKSMWAALSKMTGREIIDVDAEKSKAGRSLKYLRLQAEFAALSAK